MKKIHRLLPLLVFVLIWHIASTSGIVNSTLFPPPTDVAEALFALVVSGELFLHINASLWRVLTGLLLGMLIGGVLGMLTGRVRAISESLSPIFQVFRSFPPVAIIPFVIVWLGIGDGAKIFSIAFAVFFPVWINSHMGASRIPINYIRSASLLTKSHFMKLSKVIFPASLPFMVAGIRTGIAVAFIMVFVSELAGASSGIGYLISVSHLSYRMDIMVAALFVLGFLAAATDYLFMLSIKRIFPWINKT